MQSFEDLIINSIVERTKHYEEQTKGLKIKHGFRSKAGFEFAFALATGDVETCCFYMGYQKHDKRFAKQVAALMSQYDMNSVSFKEFYSRPEFNVRSNISPRTRAELN